MKSLSEFINESVESERLLDLNTPKDYKKRTDDEIIELFRCYKNSFHKKGKKIKDEFYGGITKDILSNLRRHKIEQYIVCVEVDSFDTATRIERLLHSELEFYIGKNEEGSAGRGGDPDSTIVYMARRDEPGFED